MRYEWDDRKNRTNARQHGLRFEDAERVFAGQTVTFVDDRGDYGEERFITLGRLAGRVVVVVHTPRGNATRIMSMRKANRHEQEIYFQRLGTP